jgi:hypothetical protein
MKILTYNYIKLDADYSFCAEGINISPGGVSFKYPLVISKGDHLKVVLYNIKGWEEKEVMAHLKVLWSESKDILSGRFGARFTKLAPDKKYKLIKLTRTAGGRQDEKDNQVPINMHGAGRMRLFLSDR